ncbi:MAG TPA: SDR family NAD(P)-dependent oxidoreductase [Croceibacterium sp.]|nr:SDR family NAD(P)-dependent oxidoreductase [Croceibacterium sp.]
MAMPVYDFSGRVAVVTGAGGGMGEAVARSLAQAGAAVTAIDRKPCPDSLKALGGTLTFAEGDLRNQAFVEKVLGETAAKHGRLDYLANIAGVLWFDRDKSLLEMDLGVWDDVMDINLRTMVLTSRAAAPLMKQNGGGAMVHFSTIQWMRGDPKPQDAYQASKAAVCALSRSLAMQLAADRIRSNAICPGPALTPMQARWNTEELRRGVAEYIPIGRVGTAEDMAQAVLFLLSDAASFITGIELVVDGGCLLRN